MDAYWRRLFSATWFRSKFRSQKKIRLRKSRRDEIIKQYDDASITTAD
jgi:hypothetical protein